MRKPLWILAVAFTIAFGLAVAGIATASTYVLADESDTAAETEAQETETGAGDEETSTDPLWEHFTGRLFAPRANELRAFAFADEEGVLVAGVEEGSALEKAGVVRGDIVLSVDGTDVTGIPALERALADATGEARLEIRHGDETKTVTIEVGEEGSGLIGLGGAPCGGPGLHMARAVAAALPAGAIVTGLQADGPAAKAGIEEGEEITALDGEKIESVEALLDTLAQHEPGDRVTVTVNSGSGDGAVEREVRVTLGEHPEDAERAFLGVMLASGGVDVMKGFPFGHMPPGMPGMDSGPIVGQVSEGSPADEAGLENGTLIVGVDGADVATAADVVAAIADHEPGDTVTLTVKSPGADEESDVRVVLGSHPDDDNKPYLGVQLGMMFTRELPEGVEGMFEGFGAPGAEIFGIPFGDTEGESDGAGGTFHFRIPAPDVDSAPAGSGSA
jgi:S1-C subfamily serine protease